MANVVGYLIFYVLLGIAWVLHVVGIATDYWTITSEGHAGLWKFCGNGSKCENMPQRFYTMRISAARGLESASLLVATASSILCVVAHCKGTDRAKMFFVLAMGMILTGVMCLVGACVFAISARYETEGGYSLSLTLTSGMLYLFVITPWMLVEPVKKLFDIWDCGEDRGRKSLHAKQTLLDASDDGRKGVGVP